MRAVWFFPLQALCGAQPLTSARATMAVQAASHPLQLLIHHQNCQRNCFVWLNFSSSGFQKHLLFRWNSENVLFLTNLHLRVTVHLPHAMAVFGLGCCSDLWWMHSSWFPKKQGESHRAGCCWTFFSGHSKCSEVARKLKLNWFELTGILLVWRNCLFFDFPCSFFP